MISYILATYSNSNPRRVDNGGVDQVDVLQVQLQGLYDIFQQKNTKKIPNLIKNIIVMCPEPKHLRNLQYYQYDKWINNFETVGIEIRFVDYIGQNKHYSYDQFIQGFYQDSDVDYYLIMEDDYCIHPSNLHFDIELVKIYQHEFKDNLGWLHWQSCLGLLSKRVIEKGGKDILTNFYKSSKYPQIAFAELIHQYVTKCVQLYNFYICPHWLSHTKTIRYDCALKMNSNNEFVQDNELALTSLYNIVAVQFLAKLSKGGSAEMELMEDTQKGIQEMNVVKTEVTSSNPKVTGSKVTSSKIPGRVRKPIIGQPGKRYLSSKLIKKTNNK